MVLCPQMCCKAASPGRDGYLTGFTLCSPAWCSQRNSSMLQEAASARQSLAAAEERREELQARLSDLQAQLAGSEAQHQALYGEHTALQVWRCWAPHMCTPGPAP